MPARNAPSASDSPSHSVSAPSPSVTSSTFSTKSSDERWRATRWNHARIGRCPKKRITASATAALSAASDSDVAISRPDCDSDGMTMRNATTARSWNSSTAMTSRAVRRAELHALGEHLRTRSRSSSSRARRPAPCPPATRNPGNEARSSRRCRNDDLREPEPEHRAAHRPQLRQTELEPDENIRNTTPNSPTWRVSCRRAARSASACSPRTIPTPRYPRIGGRRASRHTTTTTTEAASRVRTS